MCNLLRMVAWLQNVAYVQIIILSDYDMGTRERPTQSVADEAVPSITLKRGLSFKAIRIRNVLCLSSFATSRKCASHATQRVQLKNHVAVALPFHLPLQ